jgi:hypothetical protein
MEVLLTVYLLEYLLESILMGNRLYLSPKGQPMGGKLKAGNQWGSIAKKLATNGRTPKSHSRLVVISWTRPQTNSQSAHL